MDWTHWRPSICHHVEGERGHVDGGELRRHSDVCARCASELVELRGMPAALARWGSVELAAPRGFVERVVAALADHQRPTAFISQAVDDLLAGIDDLLGRVALPGDRTMPVGSLVARGFAAAAVVAGLERRYRRRLREPRPS